MRFLLVFLTAALLLSCAARTSSDPDWTVLFDGETLDGWEGSPAWFRVEEGAIVGGTTAAPIPQNEFFCTTGSFDDFELRLQFRLVGEGTNAGVQIRTERLPGSHEVVGYQADLGDGWWGALYDESRRNEKLVGPDEEALAGVLDRTGWNDYTIRAEGRRIRLWINDHPTVDYTEPDPSIVQEGRICLQIHSGPPGEAWYRAIRIRPLAAAEE